VSSRSSAFALIGDTLHSYTLPLHSVFYTHNAQLTCWVLRREETREPKENPRSIGEKNTANKLNSHMVSSELEPVSRTFGTTVVKDDTLAAYAIPIMNWTVISCTTDWYSTNLANQVTVEYETCSYEEIGQH
jgi:hypothetical protein